MIVVFGPQGSGKGTQAELLAKEEGWQWLSTGNMFRQTQDPEIKAVLNSGELVGDALTNRMLDAAFAQVVPGQEIILDGYPRNRAQAEWLLGILPKHNQKLDCALVLAIPDSELMARFRERGREDDTPEAISRRLQIYHDETTPILAFYRDRKVPIVEVEGLGSIEEVHTRIQAVVKTCLLK
jgi:adenylate kinase